jgi:hypothetical protein
MTLAETLQQKLRDLPASESPSQHAVNIPGTPWQAKLSTEATGKIANAYKSVELTRDPSTPATTTLGEWAAGIAGRVTGLLEPLRPVEIDATLNQAILRSETPTTQGPVKKYYEVHLTGTEHAEIHRYQANTETHSPREAIDFALTHEVAAKLVSDCVGE